MTSPDLLLHVEAYVGLRKALGYTIRSDEKLLKDFVAYLESRHVHGPIHAQLAVDWACLPAPGRGPSGQATRLKIVRGFLVHLRATWPETAVPGPGSLAPIRRPTPYLYTQREIGALLQAAAALGPSDSLRPYTYATLIGLSVSTGVRIGEALQLKVDAVRLEEAPPYLHIVEGKFRKSRFVPLHPTTADKMGTYARERERQHYHALVDTFFVSESGGPLTYPAVMPRSQPCSPLLVFASSPMAGGPGFMDSAIRLQWGGWWSGSARGCRSRNCCLRSPSTSEAVDKFLMPTDSVVNGSC